MSKRIIEEVISASPNRRRFLQTLGVATAAVTAMGIGAPEAEAESTGPTQTELAVLNFALNLEYLEAEFYTYGQYGYGIEHFNIGVSGVASSMNNPNGGTTTGGRQVTFTNSLVFSQQITAEIGVDERAHVVLLRSFLGSLAIAKPNINLNALGIGFGSQNEYLTLARIFEDIGVSAYGGAAYLLSTPIVIQTAARILATESQHVGTLHTQIARLNIPSPVLDGADLVPPPTGPQTQFLSITRPTGFPHSGRSPRCCIWPTAEPGSPKALSSPRASTEPSPVPPVLALPPQPTSPRSRPASPDRPVTRPASPAAPEGLARYPLARSSPCLPAAVTVPLLPAPR